MRAAVLAAVLLLSGCSSSAVEPTAEPTAKPSGSTAQPSPAGCPADRAAPDPDRPVVHLDFRLADDLASVTGTETVAFTPDLPTDRLVFRLAANAPESARAGTRLTVDDVRGSGVEGGGYRAAGAVGPGGLYVVDLRDELTPGESVEVELQFTLTLGRASFDRVGMAAGVSWWASGFPLLAWEPGVGWAEDAFVEILGETTSSPVADTTIRVSAPDGLTVLMTGAQAEPSAVRDGRRTWMSSEPVARDVSVAVGEFVTAKVTTPEGVEVTAGVLPGSAVAAAELADWTTAAMAALAQRFGAFPYASLTVPLLPEYGGGIEYPSSILLAGPDRQVLVHEVAHMWFYGMTGNSQFRDPWLDEAFAAYAESLPPPGGTEAVDRPPAVDGPPAVGGRVGAAMDEYASTEEYFTVVYGEGSVALHDARAAAGPEAFDAALRCYLRANAWRIATPEDLADALAELPAAVDVLVAAGALPPGSD